MRHKIFINGYEHYIDAEKQIIYNSESAKNGLPVDIVRNSNNEVLQIFSNHLTKPEKKQIIDQLNQLIPTENWINPLNS